MKIPEIQLDLNPRNEEAEKVIGFEWARREIGKRNKIGGNPDWIQEPDTPKCSCGKEMTFYSMFKFFLHSDIISLKWQFSLKGGSDVCRCPAICHPVCF
jgi:hypothetical protein